MKKPFTQKTLHTQKKLSKLWGPLLYWDEISIGMHYFNELVMNYLDRTKTPGIPHVIVYKDLYENYPVPVIKEMVVLVDLVGMDQINNWVENNYPLTNIKE